MPAADSIQWLQRAAIDDQLWNSCVENSPDGLIYARTVYLDHMVPGWSGLVLNNYQAIMALPARSKLGIHYLYQPLLTPQLGVMARNPSAAITNAFILQIPKAFRLIDICLNAGNCSLTGYPFTKRNNFILPLNAGYADLQKNYSENLRRNLKKTENSHLRYQSGIDYKEVIRLAGLQMQGNPARYRKDINAFSRLCQQLQAGNQLRACGIFDEAGKLTASAIFLIYNKRACYILVGNTPESKTNGASHALIDGFIREHAGEDLLLDFEGSDIPGLARYYSSFGAVNHPYPALKINRLPFWLKWIK